MSTQLKTPPKQISASARQAAKVKNYVNDQLEQTRQQVKSTDFIAGVLVVVAFMLGFLMLAAIIDGWIWSFGTFGRWACLAILVGGSISYVLFAIVPLFRKRINAEYAAKMIEEAKPSFKNSLLNYVSFRKQPGGIKPAIFDAVSRQAAADLASVPSDATVDRSKLIKLGYVLIALTLFAVAYKILSPKDPLQTFSRILAPGSKIAQPAVVKIEDVLPGDAQVFFGDQVTVTAVVLGSHLPEDVRLTYSTLDGQLVDQSIPMTAEGSGNRYSADLSMGGTGVQSSLTYRVTARDGASPDYQLIVQPNPSISIESLVLSPPRYTKLGVRTLMGQGDIEAIEGTQVSVHATANLPIKVAYIELLNEVTSNKPIGELSYDQRYRPARTSIEMQSEGNTATGRFQLTLNASGERPMASHYRIGFVSTDGDRNIQPNVYPIRVIPDLAPEIVFQNPIQPETELSENGTLAIEIEATDMDFAITSVQLHVNHEGEKIIEKRLEMISEDSNHRVKSRYLLRPSELGLKAGDRATFFAVAADNRKSPFSDQPDPNTSQTDTLSLLVTAANQEDDKRARNQDRDTQDNPNENPQANDAQEQAGENNAEDPNRDVNKGADEQDPNGQQPRDPNEAPRDGNADENDRNRQEPNNQDPEMRDPGNLAQDPAKQGQLDQADQPKGEQNPDDWNQRDPDIDPNLVNPDQDDSQPNANAENQPGGEDQNPLQQNEGQENRGNETDAEKFREILDHLENKEKQNEGQPNEGQQSQPQEGQQQGQPEQGEGQPQQGEGQQGEGQQGQQGEGQQGQQGEGQQGQQGEGQQGQQGEGQQGQQGEGQQGQQGEGQQGQQGEGQQGQQGEGQQG
ncbi:MAG: hypothetical protein AB8B55_23605, partial [Mariniblastus sp.]